VENESAELQVGDEVEFVVPNNSAQVQAAENVRKLKSGTIVLEVQHIDLLICLAHKLMNTLNNVFAWDFCEHLVSMYLCNIMPDLTKVVYFEMCIISQSWHCEQNITVSIKIESNIAVIDSYHLSNH